MKQLSQQQARYAIPAVLAVIELAGLISALLGDGYYDWIAWIALGVPLVVIAICLRGRASSRA